MVYWLELFAFRARGCSVQALSKCCFNYGKKILRAFLSYVVPCCFTLIDTKNEYPTYLKHFQKQPSHISAAD